MKIKKKLAKFKIDWHSRVAVLLTVCLLSGCGSSSVPTSWEKKYYTDAFGDETSESYIENTQPFEGTYSRGSSRDMKLKVKAYFEARRTCFILFEDGEEAYYNNSGKDIIYDISTKTSSGDTLSGKGSMSAGDNRLFVHRPLNDQLFEMFNSINEGSFKIYIEDEGKTCSYLFEATPGNFAKAYQDEIVTPILDANYSGAIEQKNSGNYDEAITIFKELGDFKDSQQQIEAIQEMKKEDSYQEALALFNEGKYDGAIISLNQLGDYKDSKELLGKVWEAKKTDAYEKAEALLANKDFDGAYDAFLALGDYKDSSERALEAIEDKKADAYEKAEALLANKDFDGAHNAFLALGDYKDSSERAAECVEAKKLDTYDKAMLLMSSDSFYEAYQMFITIPGFKDVDNLLATDDNLLKAAHIAPFKTVGSIVIFGRYEQDNITTDGKEDLEWFVINTEGERSLLICKNVIECKQFNTGNTGNTWENCSLRTWLNRDFLNEAFTIEEQAAIAVATVRADKSRQYETDPGKDTEDKVFLLSYPEYYEYIAGGPADKYIPTAYAIAQGCGEPGTQIKDFWWLRTPGRSTIHMWRVYDRWPNESGDVTYFGGVRPALWINLG